MTALDAMLAAQAYQDGRAQRTSSYRHRHLVDDPMVLVPWHLGAEPFTFAAIAYGNTRKHFELVLPGEPRDRRLLFPVTLELARWFNGVFEAPWSDRSLVGDGDWAKEVATSAPQVWVPNDGAVTVLAKLGRRLAYLPTEARADGPPPADPDLVRFGRHLQFLGARASWTGQQLIISAAQIASDNWMTEQTVAERANLAALDAWIEPPDGVHGFHAAKDAEDLSVGPLPPPSTEAEVAELIDTFNEGRRSGDKRNQARALVEQRDIYTALSTTAWELTWRVIERERRWPEEPRFVTKRWNSDVEAYSDHMAWMDGPAGGRRRARQTMRQAIRSRDQAEQVQAQSLAEEAVSDPIRMIPYLLDHRAVEGTVVSYDGDHREVKAGNTRASRVPVVTLRSRRRCLIPNGKELWWTEEPDRVCVIVDSVLPDVSGPGSIVVLKVMTHVADADRLRGASGPVCFSQLTTKEVWSGRLPTQVPWTHRSASEEGGTSLEDET
jgi:hypothetical protein